MGFEPTTPAFERAKTVHALDRGATLIGDDANLLSENMSSVREITEAQKSPISRGKHPEN
jgi:hypothetical protein